MVEEYGMSAIGPMNFGASSDITEYGKRYYDSQPISQAMQEKVDNEIKKILDEAHKQAIDVLKINRKKLDIIADALEETFV